MDNFDREWDTHYYPRTKDTPYLQAIFPVCLELLDYRCHKGHRGYCEAACDICDKGSVTPTDANDDPDHRRLVDQWHKAYTAWLNDAKKKGINHVSYKTFERETPYPKPATKKGTKLDRRSLASQQQRVTPPALFDFLE
jgi:hypothetical protein